jgi:hypothetical protein
MELMDLMKLIEHMELMEHLELIKLKHNHQQKILEFLHMFLITLLFHSLEKCITFHLK